MRENEGPIVPVIISDDDTSNFCKETKKFYDEEFLNPFFGSNNKDKNMKSSNRKNLKELGTFNMKRLDLLHQLNQIEINKLK